MTTVKPYEQFKKFPKILLGFLVFLFIAWALMELVLKPMIGDTTAWLNTLANDGLKVLIWAVPALVLISRAGKDYNLSITPKELFGVTPTNLWFALLAALGLAAYVVIGNVLRNSTILFKEIIPGGMVEGYNQVAYSTLFSSVIIAAITEELVFRGLCYNMLAKVWGHEDGNWVSALLFMLIHIPRWARMGRFTSLIVIPNLCYIFVLGMFFGIILRKTRSLWPPIVLHMINNILTEILALA